jgi:serine protease AprX
MKRIFFLITCFSLASISANAQYSRYIISFKNKNGTPFTLTNPSQYLSAKSLARRSKQHITIDSTDLPINPSYIDSIKSVKNVRFLTKSNWLNQVCISTTDADALATINAFSFVKASSPVALRIMPASFNGQYKEKEALQLADGHNRQNNLAANSINYGNTFNQVHFHNGEYLHNQGFMGENMTIAVLDAGFYGYKTNPVFDSVRLQNRVLGEWDFVAGEQSVNEDNIHGMYCFSILAANRPGSMVGSSPKAGYYLYRTEDVNSEYPVEEQNWAAAAELADSVGADLISSSLGYSDFDDTYFNHSYAQRDGSTSIITRAADLAAKKGILVVSSAGNSGASTGDLKFIDCPADGDSVMAVGAVDVNGTIAAFSSWGPNGADKRKPNVVSLGVATTIADTDGNATSGSGTSFSTPNMAGLIACLWQAFPEFNNMAIIDAAQKSCSKYNNPDNRFGYGIPDFKKAFAQLTAIDFNGGLANENCITTFRWNGKDNKAIKYNIERRVGTDTGYTTIATIPGRSDAFAMNNYIFLDSIQFALPTNIRYRLKQILPGDTALVLIDSIIAITSSCKIGNNIIISPNPVQNSINLSFNSTSAIQSFSISLYNILGQRLYYYEGTAPAGLSSHVIPATSLPAGVYVITVRDNRKIIFTGKLVK